jgi:hypothetical protein
MSHGLFVKWESCAAFIGWKHRAQARVSSVKSPRKFPKETIGHTACSERSALLQSARENNPSRAFCFCAKIWPFGWRGFPLLSSIKASAPVLKLKTSEMDPEEKEQLVRLTSVRKRTGLMPALGSRSRFRACPLPSPHPPTPQDDGPGAGGHGGGRCVDPHYRLQVRDGLSAAPLVYAMALHISSDVN